MKSPRNNFRDAFDVIDLCHPLALIAKNPFVIHLLKGLALTHVTLDLPHKEDHGRGILLGDMNAGIGVGRPRASCHHADAWLARQLAIGLGHQDRKSTRLNSSHVASSYAVFCLKKKKSSRT